MPNILQTFLPWILFFILSGQSTSSIEIASIVALISHVILNRNMIKRRFILDIGGLTFFLLFTLNVFLFKHSPVTDNAYLLSNLALALIVWLSLIIKKPFTLQYARLNTSLEVQSSELFLFINYCLTFIWAILFTLMIIPTLISPLIHATYFNDINIGINILLVVTGIWLTQHLPDWLANRLISKHTKIKIKAIFKKEKQK